MFLRFVISQIDEDSRRPQGLFVGAHELLDSGTLNPVERLRIREVLIWFNQNLPTPPNKFSAERAIFWFKSLKRKAKICIQQMWDLVHLMKEHGYHVGVHKCGSLANICYEDDLQVAAYPSPNDARITVS